MFSTRQTVKLINKVGSQSLFAHDLCYADYFFLGNAFSHFSLASTGTIFCKMPRAQLFSVFLR